MDRTAKTDSVITQPDDNVYFVIQPEDNTKCEGKVSPSQVITSLLTSSQMITPNVQALPDANINVKI
jgi:hypothetical protein